MANVLILSATKKDNIHFRFANDDKLVLNKKGDAALLEKSVEPG